MSSLAAFHRDDVWRTYSVEEIVDRYVSWVSEDLYMILTRWNNEKWKNDVFAVKCAKRGNDVYRSRVYRRFKGLCHQTKDIRFFNPKDRGKKTTRALLVTLTYDTKHCLKHEAWQNIGVEFNRFMAVVRKQFGKVSSCRVFESFENGYPHIHCILLFEYSFTVFRDGKGRFRIREKDLIARGWHSNVDVQAMSSLAGGFAYLKKYLLKGIDFEHADSKGVKTLAMCWAYRKRAFSVSGSFRETLTDLITTMHNSNRKTRQVTLTGKLLPEYPFYVIGFVPQHVVRLKFTWFRILNVDELRCVCKFLLRPCRRSDCDTCSSKENNQSQSKLLFN